MSNAALHGAVGGHPAQVNPEPHVGEPPEKPDEPEPEDTPHAPGAEMSFST